MHVPVLLGGDLTAGEALVEDLARSVGGFGGSGQRPCHDEPDGKDAAPTEIQPTAGFVEAPAPEQSTAVLLAETLFAATVLGQRVRMLETQLNALRLAKGGQWSPPESALRLTDKTI